MNTESELRARQKKGIRNTIIVILLVVCSIFLLFLNKLMSPRVFSPEELRLNGAIVFDNARKINDFELLSHKGGAFTQENLKGKWTLAFFGFANCPDICPMTLSILDKVYRKLDEDIREKTQVVMFSLDPARDTEEVLSEYLPHFNEDFVGITGNFQSILKLSRNVNIAFSKVVLEEGYTVDHSSQIVLINPGGNYQGFFKAPFELAKLKNTFSSIALSY